MSIDDVRKSALVIGIAGLLVCPAGVFVNAKQFLYSYLWAYWFWLGIAIGCGQLLILFHLVGGAWGVVTQRILEAATRTFPVMFLFVLPLVFGIAHIYPYADPARVAMDKAIQHKSLFLNVPFVLARLGMYFFTWWLIAYLLDRWGRKQDETADFKYLNWRRNLSGPGIIVYTVTVSFATIDWIMALEPDWHSTMFPGFYVVGQALGALAFIVVALRYLAEHEPLASITSRKDFQDLANLVLAFLMLWGYFELSQLIVIWSGNLPREVTWYLHRTVGGWSWIAVTLAVFHFAFPFALLLSRRAKMNAGLLARISTYLLVLRMMEQYWNVAPALHPQNIYVHWLDFAAPIGLGGIWVALFLWQLKKRPLVPEHEPRLVQALEKLT